MNLQRKQVAFAIKSDEQNPGVISGYGSVFGNTDSYGDVVEKGGFEESLKVRKKSGRPLPMRWQHKQDQVIGGWSDIKEDDIGLAMEGEILFEDIPLAKQAHALAKKGLVTGLSIGYYVQDAFHDEKAGVYRLKKLDLIEVSLVTFPANDLARVENVKNAIQGGRLPTLREFEEILRDAGFSKNQAVEIANRGLKSLLDRRESGGDHTTGVLQALKAFSFQPE